jgi:hypothetical protein
LLHSNRVRMRACARCSSVTQAHLQSMVDLAVATVSPFFSLYFFFHFAFSLHPFPSFLYFLLFLTAKGRLNLLAKDAVHNSLRRMRGRGGFLTIHKYFRRDGQGSWLLLPSQVMLPFYKNHIFLLYVSRKDSITI